MFRTRSLISIFGLFFLLISLQTYAQNSPNIVFSKVNGYDIEKVFSQISHFSSINERMMALSSYFIGRPYFLGPAGEGEDGDLDQKPLSTWEQFDCVTFVEAVMALSMIHPRANSALVNLEMYYDNIKKIKYHSEELSFLTRNHFTELDWIPYLHQINLLKDVSSRVYFFAPSHSKIIDKNAWFMNKTIQDLYLPGLNDEEKKQVLEEFQSRVRDLEIQPVKATLKYIPFKILKLSRVQKRLPSISIFSLIRDDHPTNNKIPVMVSHQGLLLRKSDGQLYIRHASTSTKKVMDIKLDEYIELRLKDAPWKSLGLNLQVML